MRLPTRNYIKKKKTIHDEDGPIYLTQKGLEKLERQLANCERDLPAAIEEVKRTAENGDFSENAAYQEAKWRMRRLHSRITSLKERIKRVAVIKKPEGSDVVQLGSTVIIEIDGKEKEYEIVGPHEADPMQGRISNQSPLGSLLMGKKAEDSVILTTSGTEKAYVIKKIV